MEARMRAAVCSPGEPKSAIETIAQITNGYVLPRCLHVVADLGVADVLDDSPESAASLAQKTGTNPDALDRVLRLLAAHGVFHVCDGSYHHSPASRLLRTDHPQSMRAFVRMVELPICWDSFREMSYSIRTGRPAADQIVKGGFWEYFRQSPETGRVFDAAMKAKSQAHIHCVLNAYDFCRFASVADIGGGRGHLLRAIMDVSPGTTGVLFDQPHVVQDAAAFLDSDRIRLQGGDFLRDPLPICDAYVLMEVIHDWSDEESLQILKAVARVAPQRAKLLLLETMIGADNEPNRGKVLDLFMLTLLTGRQRTKEQYAELLAASSFRLEQEIQASPEISILEAVPV
jgi:hypothetical protein